MGAPPLAVIDSWDTGALGVPSGTSSTAAGFTKLHSRLAVSDLACLPMNDRVVELGVRGQTARVCDQIVHFWESEEEFAEGTSFLETGIKARDYCVIFGHPEANQKVVAVLTTRGLAKELVEPRVTILDGKRASDETLVEIGVAFQRALDAGALLIRFLGNIGWSHAEWSNEDDMLQFGSKVTSAHRNFPCIVLCMYDVRTLNRRSEVRTGIGSDPSTISSDQIAETPHFVPAAQYLARYLKKDS